MAADRFFMEHWMPSCMVMEERNRHLNSVSRHCNMATAWYRSFSYRGRFQGEYSMHIMNTECSYGQKSTTYVEHHGVICLFSSAQHSEWCDLERFIKYSSGLHCFCWRCPLWWNFQNTIFRKRSLFTPLLSCRTETWRWNKAWKEEKMHINYPK